MSSPFIFCFYEQQISSSLGSSLACSCVPDQLKNNTLCTSSEFINNGPTGSHESIVDFVASHTNLVASIQVISERWDSNPTRNYLVLLLLHNPYTSTKIFVFLVWVTYHFLSPVSVFFFSCFRQIAESICLLRHARLAVCLSAWNNLAPTGRIFTKYYIRAFFLNCRENKVIMKI